MLFAHGSFVHAVPSTSCKRKRCCVQNQSHAHCQCPHHNHRTSPTSGTSYSPLPLFATNPLFSNCYRRKKVVILSSFTRTELLFQISLTQWTTPALYIQSELEAIFLFVPISYLFEYWQIHQLVTHWSLCLLHGKV